jgi:CRISPR-associated protein (TIGR02710 family)
MSTILFITVGGSPAPIITSIQSLKPDRVVFICSDGPRGSISQVIGAGTPCEIRKGAEVIERLPNLPTHLGLEPFHPEANVVTLSDPDDLSEGYQQISGKIREVKQADPDAQLYADYTGGTKTMSLSLGAAALDYGLSLYLTTSTVRENLFRVERGQATSRASSSAITIERTLSQELPRLLEQYNYGGAIALLSSLLTTYELSRDQRRRIQEYQDICAGFEAWDRFDHLQAWEFLSMRMQRVQAYGLALKRVLSSREAIDAEFTAPTSIPGQGYELVEDLLLNAERRAHQHRYDDAVGRLYRALELLAQIRLRQAYDIITADVNLAQLPESLRERYATDRHPRTGQVRIPLWKSYTLLSELPEDPLGQLVQPQAQRLLNALEVRNHSLFAHGFKPITASDYGTFGLVIKDFIEAGLQRVVSHSANSQVSPLPQFPQSL